MGSNKLNRRIVFWGIKIFIPSLLCILLFISIIFIIEIPAIKKNYLTLKREMIANLVENSTDILAFFHNMETTGQLTRKEAQHQAMNQLRKMRYGHDKKDYFWINDLVPKMVMHPYRSDLEGKDVSEFMDLNGKYLFREFVDTAKNNGQGFVDYMWQWKDDPSKIVPKLSFVKEFKPWGWIVGTGIYIEDVQKEIADEINKLLGFSLAVFLFAVILSLFILVQSYQIEKKRYTAENALRETHDDYKALIENINLGVFKLALPEEKLLKVNMEFAKIFAFENINKILEVEFSNLFYDARDKEKFIKNEQGILSINNMDCVFKKKDGSGFYGSITAKPIYNDKNQPIGIDGVIEDITERKKVESQKHRLLKSLEAKNEELKNIVCIAYHDLRSPLTNIEGFSAVIKEYCDDLKNYLITLKLPKNINHEILFMLDEAVMMALNRISVDVNKMERLIEGLLKISRLGQSQLHLKQINMNQLIETVFADFENCIKKNSLKINIENLPDCYSDPELVYKLFYHLIDNATKYLAADKIGEITVSGKRKNSECVFAVQDNGIGISLAHQKKVFEIFHRLNPEGNVAGEGLGLTIVKMILHRLDGSIWFESNCLEGSTFFVSLPACKKNEYAVSDT